MKASEAFIAGIIGGLFGSFLTILSVRSYKKLEKDCEIDKDEDLPEDWEIAAAYHDDTDSEEDGDWMTGGKDDSHLDSEDDYHNGIVFSRDCFHCDEQY